MSPASSANARKGATPPKRKAPTRNEQPTSGELIPTVEFVPVAGNKANKAQEKRKRDESDEGSPTAKKGKVAQDGDKFKEDRNLLRRHMQPKFERDKSGKLSLKHYAGITTSAVLKIFSTYCRRTMWRASKSTEMSTLLVAAQKMFLKNTFPSKWKRRLSTTQSASDKGESSKVAGIDRDWAIADRMHEKTRQWLEGQHWRTSNRYQFTPEDHLHENKWNADKYFLPETHPEYSERHALSQALKTYEREPESKSYEPYDDTDDWAL